MSPSNFINEDVTLDSAHPIHVLKLGRIGYRLELSERSYEVIWSVTEETSRGMIEIHEMASYPGDLWPFLEYLFPILFPRQVSGMRRSTNLNMLLI